MKKVRSWPGFLLAMLIAPVGPTLAMANPCLPFMNGVVLCPLPLTRLAPQGNADTVRVATPVGPGTSEFGAYFRAFPGRSLSVGLDVFVTDGVKGAWLEALAQVHSGSVSTAPDGSDPRGVYSPLGCRIAHSIPKPGSPGILTVSAELPKTLSQRVKVVVSDHGNVVWRDDSQAASALAVVRDWPDGLRTEMLAMGGLAYSWHFEHSALIRILRATGTRDSNVTGDELQIEGPGAPAMALSQMLVKASGMDSLTFANPQATYGAPFTRPVHRGGSR